MPPPGTWLDVEIGEAHAREAFARLERNPRDPDGLFALAVVLGASGRPQDAIQVLSILAKVAPHYPGLWRLKARLHREAGDEKMAALCERAERGPSA